MFLFNGCNKGVCFSWVNNDKKWQKISISFCNNMFYSVKSVCKSYMISAEIIAVMLPLKRVWLIIGKRLTSWVSCVLCFLVFCHFLIWCLRSGAVLGCVDFWALLSSLLLNCYFVTDYRQQCIINYHQFLKRFIKCLWLFPHAKYVHRMLFELNVCPEPFDTLIVLMKHFLKRLFWKKSQMTTTKPHSLQKVNIELKLSLWWCT